MDALVAWTLSSRGRGRGDSGCSGIIDVIILRAGVDGAIMVVLPQCLRPGSHSLTGTKGRREALKLQKALHLPAIVANTRKLKLHVYVRLEGTAASTTSTCTITTTTTATATAIAIRAATTARPAKSTTTPAEP